MNIEVRTDKHIENTARMADYIRSQLTQKFDRYSEKLTHVEVHFSDENAEKGGERDKRCAIEARLAGLKPIGVTHKAPNVDLALDGAIEKLQHSLNHHLGKLNDQRHQARPNWQELSQE
ncbi:HPF/RaiA family ribosome-associated protein [Alkanindiges sp. WGS2144]|uniref:HPF/RaiA family ribosome-associated protein n=1 Tax=Alkanindiges sp. WGS2144 TaxID=3366808 RepID=UPI00375388C1